MIKEPIKSDYVTHNIYTSNIGILKLLKQILTNIKGEINSNKVIVGDLKKNPLTSMDRSFRQEINRKWWPK